MCTCASRLAERDYGSDTAGAWARLAELELRCIKLQREAQESRGAVLDGRAALRRCEGERAALQEVYACADAASQWCRDVTVCSYDRKTAVVTSVKSSEMLRH